MSVTKKREPWKKRELVFARCLRYQLMVLWWIYIEIETASSKHPNIPTRRLSEDDLCLSLRRWIFRDVRLLPHWDGFAAADSNIKISWQKHRICFLAKAWPCHSIRFYFAILNINSGPAPEECPACRPRQGKWSELQTMMWYLITRKRIIFLDSHCIFGHFGVLELDTLLAPCQHLSYPIQSSYSCNVKHSGQDLRGFTGSWLLFQHIIGNVAKHSRFWSCP